MKNEALKNLSVRLLDSEHGIPSNAYRALLEILPQELATQLNLQVEGQDDQLFLPEGHNLGDWKIPHKDDEDDE